MVDATRDRLVAAGVSLLEEYGSENVGLREIARAAGLSHGAPRRWFPTHQSLLGAVARAGVDDLAADLATAVGDDPADRLTELVRTYVGFAIRRPAMFRLIFRHDLLEQSGQNLRSHTRPMFESFVQTVGGSRLRATQLWTHAHGIATLASTGALQLIEPGVEVDGLIADMLSFGGRRGLPIE